MTSLPKFMGTKNVSSRYSYLSACQMDGFYMIRIPDQSATYTIHMDRIHHESIQLIRIYLGSVDESTMDFM